MLIGGVFKSASQPLLKSIIAHWVPRCAPESVFGSLGWPSMIDPHFQGLHFIIQVYVFVVHPALCLKFLDGQRWLRRCIFSRCFLVLSQVFFCPVFAPMTHAGLKLVCMGATDSSSFGAFQKSRTTIIIIFRPTFIWATSWSMSSILRTTGVKIWRSVSVLAVFGRPPKRQPDFEDIAPRLVHSGTDLLLIWKPINLAYGHSVQRMIIPSSAQQWRRHW